MGNIQQKDQIVAAGWIDLDRMQWILVQKNLCLLTIVLNYYDQIAHISDIKILYIYSTIYCSIFTNHSNTYNTNEFFVVSGKWTWSQSQFWFDFLKQMTKSTKLVSQYVFRGSIIWIWSNDYPVFKKWILKNARMESFGPHKLSIIALFLIFQELKSELEFLKIAKIHFSDPLLETNLRPKLRF